VSEINNKTCHHLLVVIGAQKSDLTGRLTAALVHRYTGGCRGRAFAGNRLWAARVEGRQWSGV
jgi:hypothetical protein